MMKGEKSVDSFFDSTHSLCRLLVVVMVVVSLPVVIYYYQYK